jgi:ADP-heptose:LPS heptosyltransferase
MMRILVYIVGQIGDTFAAVPALRTWPFRKWCILMRVLVNRWNVWLIVLGGPSERDMAARLFGECGVGHSAAGRLSLRESTAALINCSLYLGHDTSAMHMAASVGLPCIAMFSK